MKIHKIGLPISIIGILLSILELGFTKDFLLEEVFANSYAVIIVAGLFVLLFDYLQKKQTIKKSVLLFDGIILIFSLFLLIRHFGWISLDIDNFAIYNTKTLKLAVALIFIREISIIKINYKKTQLNPAQLFVGSFVLIILLGSLFLSLPNATYKGIPYIDALFTATSAVCVTGLIVVDTGSYFTPFGQFIILSLIQLGGLGILTFASYFSFFFKGGATYDNQLVFRDLTNSQKLGEVYGVLKKTILITAIIEIIGAISIFFTIEKSNFISISDQFFFAIFHSVSAFCNAGFSTLPDSLYQIEFRFNYSLQLIVFIVFFLGGLGFPIVANIVNYVKYLLKRISVFAKRKAIYKPWVLSITSRITLITTFIITVVAVSLFMLLEYNNTLSEHDTFFGKLVVGLFSAATPRTAGFNVINTNSMLFSTTMLIFLLMWIGASPGSTGGGIKTSTFAIATLNFISLAKGKNRIEVFRREVADISVKRAFAVISLSLVAIGLSVAILSALEPQFDLISIAFESFSAYSTVGLSLGITSELSNASRVVLIILMFIGRIGMLTLMVAVFQKVKYKNYRYPTEEILIN